MRRSGFTLIELLIVIAILAIAAAIIIPVLTKQSSGSAPSPAENAPSTEAAAAELMAIEAQLKTPTDQVWQDGLAAIVLVDVSGSMKDRVRDQDGQRRRKIEVAHRTATDLVGAFEAYAREHANERVQVGIFEFSDRTREPAARQVVALGPPNAETARGPIAAMRAEGGTPIGDALIVARKALDASGLRRRHLIVLTDGENTEGREPAPVVRAMERQSDEARAGLYFVAFDISADVFGPIKEAGGLLLSAKDGAELATTFRELLSDRILVEAPRQGVER